MKREKVKIDKSLSKLMEIRHSGTYSLFTFTYSLNRQVSKGKSREWGNSEERRVKSEKVKIDKSLSKLMEIRHRGTYSLFTFTYSLNRQVSKGKSREWGNSEERRVKSEKVKIDKSLSKLMKNGNTSQRTYSLFTFTYSLNRQVSKGKSREWGNSEERRVKSEKVKIDKSLSKLVDFGGGRWIRTIEGIASRFTVCPLWPLGNSPICNSSVGGAGRRTRTPDLLITNQLLYQLSYTSTTPAYVS